LQTGKSALQKEIHPFTRKVYFANRCSSDAYSDGKTIENDLSKAGIAEVTYS